MIPDIKIEFIGALKVESVITNRFIATLPNLLIIKASTKIRKNKTKAEKKTNIIYCGTASLTL